MFREESHDLGLGEPGRQPERRRAHERGVEVPIVRCATGGGPGGQASVRVGPVGEKHADKVHVAAHDRDVESGEPGLRGAGVRALVQQERYEIPETGSRGEGRGAHSPGVGVVHIRTRVHEDPGRGEITHPGREHQRRVSSVGDGLLVGGLAVGRHGHHLGPGVGPGVDVRSVLEQYADGVRMTLERPPT